MPVLEAMQAGVPVITSNRSALPEVAGDAAILVNPEDTSEISAALRSLTEDARLAQRLIAGGKSRAQMFSWEKAVGETWDVYGRLLG
jgi:glycosyltransferase involved in cell wall biosynthesis